MSEDVDALITRVAEEAGKKENDVRKEMDERKEKTHGLLSDYGAVYAVAKSYGIDLSEKEIELTPLKKVTISQSVNVVGRVKTVYSPREFERKDGGVGKFASLILTDKDGEIRIVLWDQNTELVKKIQVGDILLVKNGYSKENRGGLEIHAGGLTNLSVNPKDLSIEIPEIVEKITRLDDLKEGDNDATVVVRVSRYYPVKEFERKDGSVGKRASFMAEDESGKIRCVLWDNSADAKISEGDIVKVAGAYTKMSSFNDELELQAGGRSLITLSKAKLKLPDLPKRPGLVKVSDIEESMQGVTVEAKVLEVYPPREYSGGVMSSLTLGDDTGTIRVVLWNEQAENAEKLNTNDAVRVKNAYSKANFNDEVELHIGKYGEVEVDSSLDVESVPLEKTDVTQDKKIIDLEDNMRNVKVDGSIVAVEDRPLFYSTCPECGVRVQELSGSYMCDSCGMVEPQYNMVASIVVEDATSNIRVVAFREVAEALLGVTTDDAMNMVGETQDDHAPLKAARENRVGAKVTVVGNTRYNDYNDTLELIAQTVE